MPLLVLVDVQKEYITPDRPFCLENIDESLANIGRLLAHARKKGWKIVHMRHEQNDECFAYSSPWTEFIEGFEPQEGEVSLIKSNFSCFSNPEFKAIIDKWRHEDIILAGYSASMCCLSTMIDAHHRGHEFTYVGDASLAKRTERYGEQDMLEHIRDIIGAFGRQATTEEILAMD